jgi:hypothetical protein
VRPQSKEKKESESESERGRRDEGGDGFLHSAANGRSVCWIFFSSFFLITAMGKVNKGINP